MSEQKTQSSINALLAVMERLRDPQTGCRWDLEQSYESIAPSTIEEAYEVVDAIERKDYKHLKEELGDLLFQVVFYSQLGREDGRFTFDEIAQGISDKLVRRHPHVFPDGTVNSRVDPHNRPSEADVKQQWEAIKTSERAEKGQRGALSDVPVTMPSIERAYKLQKRAALVGFDWPDVEGVTAKLHEEVGELEQAIASGSQEAIEAELGDALFSLINLARHVKVEPESALRACNRRFVERFQHMESTLHAQGKNLAETETEEMEALWQEAKKKLHPR